MPITAKNSLAAAITLALGVSHAHATDFNVSSNADAGPGTLREALSLAAADSNIPHTINLSGIAGQTISTESLLEFSPGLQDMDLTIVGSDVTVAGDGSSGVFAFNASYSDYGLDVTISDLTISGGDSSQPGAGILFESGSKYDANSLSLDNVTVTGNRSDEFGGGVGVYGAHLTITDSVISNNEANSGGGVFHIGGSTMISGSTIDNNITVASNGDLEPLNLPTVLREHPALRGGPPPGFAAGIFSFGENGIELLDSSVSGNNAESSVGGSFLASGSDIGVAGSTISDNSAGKYFGGLFAYNYGDINIEGSTISGNSAEALGGVIAFTEASVLIENSTISNNSADDEVGGIYAISGYADLVVRSTTISGNSANDIGGGVLTSFASSVLLENSTVSGNSDSSEVGGLLIVSDAYYGSIDISFSTIVNNLSSTGFGGVVMSMYYDDRRGFGPYGEMLASGSIIAGNFSDGQPSDLSTGGGGPTPESRQSFNLFGMFDREDQSRGVSPIEVNHTLLGSISLSLSLDTVSQDLLGLNPLLGPLAGNGGPTLTHLPGTNSPVIDAAPQGVVGCGTTVTGDQRGETRPQGSACTLGSVEPLGVLQTPPLAVPTGNRIGLMLMAGLLGLAGLVGMRRRRKPLT